MILEPGPFHNKIFFCDVVGYSRLDPVDQQWCQRRLTGIATEVLSHLGVVLEGSVIALPTGDGVVLNFPIQRPDIHLLAAIETLRRVEGAFSLRIGLATHVDAIVIDVNGRKNIVGNGINMAQRVMDLGSGNQILMHDQVRTELQNYAAYLSKIAYCGLFTVKHGNQLPVSQYIDPDLPFLNNEPIAPQTTRPPTVLDLDGLLSSRVEKELITLKLDARATSRLTEIRDHLSDFLQQFERTQRFRVLATWICSEMIDNAVRHGQLPLEEQVILRMALTKAGVLIEMEQPDLTGVDVPALLEKSPKAFSFMRILKRQGMQWHQKRVNGRLTLSVEVPHDFVGDLTAMIPPEPQRREKLRWWQPSQVFGVSELGATVAKVPMRRLEGKAVQEFATFAREWIRPNHVLVLDFCNVGYVSSNGLRALFGLARHKKYLPTMEVILTNVSTSVVEIFRLSNMHQVFEIQETPEVALKLIQERRIAKRKLQLV